MLVVEQSLLDNKLKRNVKRLKLLRLVHPYELDDIHEDTPNVTIPNAVSIDELTKPRPTASQNTRRRDQRQPQVPQDQQYVQVNPMPTAPIAPLAPQNEQQSEEQNPPRIYP